MYLFLIITIFSFLYFSAPFPNDIVKTIVFVLLFVGTFSLFNLFFHKYYFGDSSCFVIANIINFILIFAILSHEFNYNIGLSPLILPIVDVVYVILLRISLGESFLFVRNYYHLYQRIASNIKGYWYITPTIIFPFIIVFCNYLILDKIFENKLIILIYNLLTVLLFYIIALKLLKKFLN